MGAEYRPTLWELGQLVGNQTAFAIQKPDGSYYPVQNVSAEVFVEAMRKHLAGEHTIGFYTNAGDKAKTLVFDVDSGEDAKAEIIKLRKVLANEYGIPPQCHGVEFSGNKGFHLWVLFPVYVPANHLRRLGRAVAALAEVDCEVFPKNDLAHQLGNLVKAPGGKHQKTGKANNFLTPFPQPVTREVYEAAVAKLPEEKRFTGGDGTQAYPCLTKIQEGMTEGGRNNSLFHFCVMARRNGISADNLWLLAEAVNNKFDPPLEDQEFRRTVESAIRGGGPICSTLPEDAHCGDLCIARRERGLYMRPKQLQFGGEGEKVVVEIKKRTGTVLELSHPDLAVCKAKVHEKKE